MNIPKNFDRWMFDYKEGNLSGSEMESFENFLVQNPQFEVDADSWNDAFIQNEQFVYPNASELQKDNRFAAGWYAAAALLLLLIGTSAFFLSQNNSTEIEGISSTSEEIENTLIHGNEVSTPELEEKRASLIDVLANLAASNNGGVASNITNNLNNNGVNNNGVNNNNGVQNIPNGLANNQNLNPTNNVNGIPTNGLAVNNSNPQDNGNFSGMADPTAKKYSIDQEFAKYEGEDHKSAYDGNPEIADLGFDVSKKPHYDPSKLSNKVKRFWNKVEDAFDVPPSYMTNLGDPEMLLPNSSIIAFNPGFVGGLSGTRVELNYRNQWIGSDQNSQLMSLSIDKYVPEMRGGVGISFNAKDYQYGQFGDYSMSLAYSPKIQLGNNVIFEPAAKMTLGVMSANGSKLSPDSDIEFDRGHIISTPAAQQMTGTQQLWYKDYGFGFVLNAKKFYAGFSADNLNKHYENVYNTEGFATPTSSPVRYNAIAGFDFDKKHSPNHFSASPFVAYQQFGDRKELWGGVNFVMNRISLGGSVAHTLDFTGSLGLKFEKFKMIYHYDHTTSILADEQLGSHNISMRFNVGNKNNRRIAN